MTTISCLRHDRWYPRRFRRPEVQLVPFLLTGVPRYAKSITHLAIESDMPFSSHQPLDALFHPTFWMAWKSSFSNVIALTMDHVTFTSSSTLFRLVISLPSVLQLHLRFINFDNHHGTQLPSVPSRKIPRLRSITFDSRGSLKEFVALGCKHALFQSLQSLTKSGGLVFSNLLKQAAGSLQYLMLSGGAHVKEYPALKAALLSCTSIRYLSIHHYTPQFIDIIPSHQTLEEINLYFSLYISETRDDMHSIVSRLYSIHHEAPSTPRRIKLFFDISDECIVHGSCAQRSQQRAALRADVTKWSDGLRQLLQERGGGMVVEIS